MSLTKIGIGTPQARWRDITQSGLASIMPVMRFWPEGGTHWVSRMARSASWRSVKPSMLVARRFPSPLRGGVRGGGGHGRVRGSPTRRFAPPSPQGGGYAGGGRVAADRPVHGDEPLRRVAEDDGLLGAPGVRVLVLEAAAGDQRVGLRECLDDRVVGVALVAVLLEHALALEAGGVAGESAVGVDGEGDVRADAARDQVGLIGHPNLEVVAAVAGRRVHEAGAVLVGDVIAVEQRHVEVITHLPCRGCAANAGPKHRIDICPKLEGLQPSPLSSLARQAFWQGSA